MHSLNGFSVRRKTRFSLHLVISIFLVVSLSACNSNSGSDSSIGNAVSNIFNSSPNVNLVKEGNIQSCPTATLGQMADAFMSDPSWREFSSTSGGTVVELTGQISYEGLPATATIQFEVTGDTFKAVYLGINDVDQSLFVLSGLLSKMCAAA